MQEGTLRSSSASRHSRDIRRRAGRRGVEVEGRDLTKFLNPMGLSFARLVCIQWRDIVPGAQTERRGGAGPVRGLLGGKDPTGRFMDALQIDPGQRATDCGRMALYFLSWPVS